jgi:hypothetical protein
MVANELWYVRTIRAALLLAFALLGSIACSPKSDDGSKVRIQFPAAPSLSSMKRDKVSNLVSTLGLSDFSWSKVCFAVNVTASDIVKPVTPTPTCEIPVGIFSGSVPPGGEISLSIARGSARKLEVFVYLRNSSSDPCPSLQNGFGSLDHSRISRVGFVSSFEVKDPTLDLPVDVSQPASGDDLVAQYQLPSSCRPATISAPGGGASRVSLGSTKQSGGKFNVFAVVSAQKNEATLSGGSFKVKLSRRPE